MTNMKNLLGVSTIQGFLPPLPSIRIIHPVQGEGQVPLKWLQIGTEYLGGEALSCLLYSVRQHRELQEDSPSGTMRVCYSLDGVKPHEGAVRPQSLTCADCPMIGTCDFVHTVFIQDEHSGLAGLWALRGMAANRFAQFLSVFSSDKVRKEAKFPLRVTVRPVLVSAQRRLFTVPQFGVNSSTRLSEKERETAIEVLQDRYDLKRLQQLASIEE